MIVSRIEAPRIVPRIFLCACCGDDSADPVPGTELQRREQIAGHINPGLLCPDCVSFYGDAMAFFGMEEA